MLKLLNLGLSLIVTITTGTTTTDTPNKNFDFLTRDLNTIMSDVIKDNIERDLFPTRSQQVGLSLLDFEFMARVVSAEAGLSHWDNQVAVAQVIWNRVGLQQFSDTVYGVLTQEGQFSTVNHKECLTETNDSCRDAIVYAYLNSPHPKNILSFRTDYYFEGLEPYQKIGDNYFTYEY